MGGMGEAEKGDGRETSDARRETRDEREMAGGLADGEWRMANGGKGEALGLKGAGWGRSPMYGALPLAKMHQSSKSHPS